MKQNGDYEKMEPFMPSTTWNSIIDMELGPDGKLYMLEYGNGAYIDNPDAGLSRIDYYSGSLPPKASLNLEKSSGKLPMQLKVSAKLSSENVNKPLTYIWHFGTKVITTKEAQTTFELITPGSIDVFLEVKDSKGVTYTTQSQTINAGNDIPQVKIILEGNPTFYKAGIPVHYKVVVNDVEDGKNIDTSGIAINIDYTKTLDKAWALTKYAGSVQAVGKALMEASDCKACHKTNEMSVAPSFYAISEKYNGDPHTIEMLASKIINGGSGVWGERAMAAHPNIKPADAQSIVKWILSLNSKN
jgi:cytochrome c551/c552